MIRCCSKLVVYRHLPSRNLICIISSRYASTDCKPPNLMAKKIKRVFYTAAGLALVGVAGTVVYAKHDPDTRKKLENYVPGSDKFIRFVYQEDGKLTLEDIKDKILNLPKELYNKGIEAIEKFAIWKSIEVFGKSVKKYKPIESKSTDAEAEKIAKDEKKEADAGKKDAPKEVVNTGNEAVSLYKQAIQLVEGKENKIPDQIDKAVEENDVQLWNDIRKQIEEEKESLAELEKIEKKADELNKKYLSEKKALTSRSKLTDDSIKQLNSTEKQLSDLKSELQRLKALKIEAPKKYFNKIEDGRKHFLEELNALFPGIRLAEKQMKLAEDEIDLFLYYAVQKMNYYQKEIAKLESQALDKLRRVVQGNPALQESIDTEVSKARREIKEEFDKKILDLKSTCDSQLHDQLKRQEQVHIDLLNEHLARKEAEVEEKLKEQLEERVNQERQKQELDLAEMTTKMQALNEAISKRALQDKKALNSQGLWNAAEAMYHKLKRSSTDEPASEIKPKPLAEHVEAIKKASAEGDDLVETVLSTISDTAKDRGVYPEDTLRERFLKVESVAWRVAGIPEGGASLPKLLFAWVQSKLIFRSSEPIPPSELKNEAIDPCSLNNYDILQRSRYWVDRGDFEQALKYMNLLKGGARSVSLDWMKEVTLLLEAKQAANLLLAHASASGMV